MNAKTCKHWSDSQKVEAVTTYIMTGNKRLTADTLKIPYDTIKTWAKMDWWNDMVSDFQKEEKVVLNKRLKNLVDVSLDVAADRLQNGDWIYDQKTGELRRKPVSLRDAGKVANDAINIIQKTEVQEHASVANEQIEEKLAKLAQAFMNLSRGITNNQAVEDAIIIETEPKELTNDISGNSLHGDAERVEATEDMPSMSNSILS